MEKTHPNLYDEILLSAVFELDKFPKKSGQEGTAYFIDENFVIKEMMGDQDSFFKYENFEKYCRELQDFHKKGLAVPEIYSWTMLPKTMFKNSRFDRYYVLQERVKGKEMMNKGLSYSYEDCKDFCSREEFNGAILSQEGELYKKIVLTFLENSLRMNEQLAELPESVIENFILSDYEMMRNEEYGAVDMHSGNVLFDGKKLTVIDNGFIENFFATYNDEKVRQIVMKDILRLMSGNLTSLAFGAMVQKKVPEAKPINKKHKVVCTKVMKRFVNSTNRLLHPVFHDDMEYVNSVDFIKSVADKEDEEEILSMLQKDF